MSLNFLSETRIHDGFTIFAHHTAPILYKTSVFLGKTLEEYASQLEILEGDKATIDPRVTIQQLAKSLRAIGLEIYKQSQLPNKRTHDLAKDFFKRFLAEQETLIKQVPEAQTLLAQVWTELFLTPVG